MTFTPTKLSMQKGSSLTAQLPIQIDATESLVGYRSSAYIKANPSDTKMLCIMDAQVDAANKIINLSILPSRSSILPAGQFVYYVELFRTFDAKIVGRAKINIEP